ncbi:MAG: hypothetical protein E6R03_12715 [Hyphomicrobiaceae bacterium]|nr:MAG: hypothetical protein E6R03_12715 [Hyphomicrobiaceae bacterium]
MSMPTHHAPQFPLHIDPDHERDIAVKDATNTTIAVFAGFLKEEVQHWIDDFTTRNGPPWTADDVNLMHRGQHIFSVETVQRAKSLVDFFNKTGYEP